jgi:hypothetical protein
MAFKRTIPMTTTSRRILFAALLGAQALAVSAPAMADSKPWPGPRPTYDGYQGGGETCTWQRQRVRVFDEYSGTYVWVWKRVRVCY